jgi:hypothetical protein
LLAEKIDYPQRLHDCWLTPSSWYARIERNIGGAEETDHLAKHFWMTLKFGSHFLCQGTTANNHHATDRSREIS